MNIKWRALEIAEYILAAGRIEDPEDWDEMEVCLSFELDERGIDGEQRTEILRIVKERWYFE